MAMKTRRSLSLGGQQVMMEMEDLVPDESWTPAKGDKCQAKWTDGFWYDGVVEDAISDEVFLVYFEDYSESCEMPRSCMRVTKQEASNDIQLTKGQVNELLSHARILRDRSRSEAVALSNFGSSANLASADAAGDYTVPEPEEETDDDDDDEDDDEDLDASEAELLDEMENTTLYALVERFDQHPLFGVELPDAVRQDPSHKSYVRSWKRLRTVREIVETEASYVEQLESLVDVYVSPIKNSEPGELVATPYEVAVKVFSNIDIISALNRQFLSDLQKRVLEWGEDIDSQLLGDLFVQFAPYFKMYSQYVNNHEAATRYLERLMTERSFESFQKFLEAAGQDPRCRLLSLHSFLITPIQRIPRYKLLLAEVLRYTDEDHPDHAPLQKALELVSSVATHINEAMRQKQNRDTMRVLQTQFVTDPHFISPSRHFIRQGPLTKKCRSGPKKYEFFLFNDMLAYAQSVGGWRFKLHRKLAFDSAFEVSDLPDQPTDQPHRIMIINSQKSFICHASDEQDKLSWLEDFDDAVAQFRKSGAVKKAKRAPISASAQKQNCCTMCRATFSILNRKKTCRFCGCLVCNACSQSRLKLDGKGKNVDDTPKRVCDDCATKLTAVLVDEEDDAEKFNQKRGSSKSVALPRRSKTFANASGLVASKAPMPARPPPVSRDVNTMKHLVDMVRKQKKERRTSVKIMAHPELASDEEPSSDDEDDDSKDKTLAKKVTFKKRSQTTAPILPVNSTNFTRKSLRSNGAVLLLPNVDRNVRAKASSAFSYMYKGFDRLRANSQTGDQKTDTSGPVRAKKRADEHILSIDSARNLPSAKSQHQAASHRTLYYIKLRTKRGVERTIPKLYSHIKQFHQQWKLFHPHLNVKYQLPPLRQINNVSEEVVEQRRKELEAYLQGLSTVPDLAERLADFLGVPLQRWKPDDIFYKSHDDWKIVEQRTMAFASLRDRFERRSSGANADLALMAVRQARARPRNRRRAPARPPKPANAKAALRSPKFKPKAPAGRGPANPPTIPKRPASKLQDDEKTITDSSSFFTRVMGWFKSDEPATDSSSSSSKGSKPPPSSGKSDSKRSPPKPGAKTYSSSAMAAATGIALKVKPKPGLAARLAVLNEKVNAEKEKTAAPKVGSSLAARMKQLNSAAGLDKDSAGKPHNKASHNKAKSTGFGLRAARAKSPRSRPVSTTAKATPPAGPPPTRTAPVRPAGPKPHVAAKTLKVSRPPPAIPPKPKVNLKGIVAGSGAAASSSAKGSKVRSATLRLSQSSQQPPSRPAPHLKHLSKVTERAATLQDRMAALQQRQRQQRTSVASGAPSSGASKGVNVNARRASQAQGKPVVQSGGVKFCQECGAKRLDKGWKFCDKCGTSFDGML